MFNPDYLKLKNWYLQHRRLFPWRKETQKDSLYAMWIREMMSQQTVITTIIEKWLLFLDTFPTIESLADSHEEQVLQAWQGLGYYQRARSLHQSAKIIAQKGWPQTYEEWLSLKGVGPYTAAMMSSVISHRWMPAIDGNVFRVLSRYWGEETYDTPKVRSDFQKKLQSEWTIEEGENPNEWLIELGATICKSTNPTCGSCPLQSSCRAFQNQKVELIPLKKPRPSRISLFLTARCYITADTSQVWLQKRKNGFLKNTIGFPLQKTDFLSVWDFEHQITHHRLLVHVNPDPNSPLADSPQEGQWVPIKNLTSLLTSRLDLKILDHIHRKIRHNSVIKDQA